MDSTIVTLRDVASADGFVCKSQFTSEVTALIDVFFNAPEPLVDGSAT